MGFCDGKLRRRRAPVKIIDAKLVVVAEPLGNSTADFGVEDGRHRELFCNYTLRFTRDDGNRSSWGSSARAHDRVRSRTTTMAEAPRSSPVAQALTGDFLRCRRRTTWSRTRWATSHLLVSGTSTTSSRVMMMTALRSESNPTPWRETSLTTIASRFLEKSFWRAFSRTFSVSAAKPTMIC